MSITEQYNNELYHYGVKGMKWGVRRARKQQATALRKHNQYMTKYQKATSKGDSKKAGRYASEAWKQRAKLELATKKIRELDPDSYKKAEEKVRQWIADSQAKSSTSSSTNSSTSGTSKQKKRYIEMNEAERQKFDDNYTNKRKRLIDQYKSATSDSEKERIRKRVDQLENDYLNEVEQDW